MNLGKMIVYFLNMDLFDSFWIDHAVLYPAVFIGARGSPKVHGQRS